MKTSFTAILTSLALVAFTIPALAAGINGKATSTSHALEEVSAELHGHMHHNYSGSLGAHGMETTADEAHGVLHDWSHGDATVAEVLASIDAANAAFDDMTDQFNAAGVLSGSGQDKEAKKLYHEVHKTLVKLNAYTASAS